MDQQVLKTLFYFKIFNLFLTSYRRKGEPTNEQPTPHIVLQLDKNFQNLFFQRKCEIIENNLFNEKRRSFALSTFNISIIFENRREIVSFVRQILY